MPRPGNGNNRAGAAQGPAATPPASTEPIPADESPRVASCWQRIGLEQEGTAAMSPTGSTEPGPADPAGPGAGSAPQRATRHADRALRLLVDAPPPATDRDRTLLAVALERHLRIRDDQRHLAGSRPDPLLVAAAWRYIRLPDKVVDERLQMLWAQHAASGSRRLYGDDDLRTLEALRWLAVLLDADGQLARAGQMYEQVADAYRGRGEPLMMLRTHADLAINLHRRGHCTVACTTVQAAWDLWRQQHRDRHDAGRPILFCFTVALRGCGDLDALETVRHQADDAAIAVPAAGDYGISDDALAVLLEQHRTVCERRRMSARSPPYR
jgi:hypothetical protein